MPYARANAPRNAISSIDAILAEIEYQKECMRLYIDWIDTTPQENGIYCIITANNRSERVKSVNTTASLRSSFEDAISLCNGRSRPFDEGIPCEDYLFCILTCTNGPGKNIKDLRAMLNAEEDRVFVTIQQEPTALW